MARIPWAPCVALVVAAGVSACAGESDSLRDDDVGGDGGIGMAGRSGSDSGSEECVSDPSTGVTLTSDISVLGQPSIDTFHWQPYDGQVEVRALGTNNCWAVTTYDSSEPELDIGPAFQLGGLAPVAENWIRARSIGSGDPLVPHITMVGTPEDRTLDNLFWMMPESVLDEIYAQVGVTRIPGRAHMLIEVVGLFGPYAGAQVELGDAEVAYSGGGWSAGTGATGVDGLALIMNVDAPEHPGDMLPVTLVGNSQTNVFLAAAGYLTFGRVSFRS